ncbi:hypothetical protein MBLNU230_g8331t1 [Neophaeotheca triangularis]
MSKDLMTTDPGGEQTQYESIATHMDPHAKSGGQMGNPSTAVDSKPETAAQETAERGAKTAENVRYGQTISEGGMAGFTKPEVNGGVAGNGGEQGSLGAKGERKAAGYGGEKDMDREVGA